VREDPVLIEYKGEFLDEGYRLDFLVEDVLILEMKAVEKRVGHS
jgi:GxxExxY protein